MPTTTGQNTCIERIGTAYNLSCTAVGDTLLASIEAGRTFIPTIAYVRLTAVVGFVAVPSLSIGTNSTPYDNILGATALTGLITANTVYAMALPTTVPAATSDVYVKVATATASVTYTVAIDLFGYYQD